jgi:hypothetical protein
VKLVRAWLHYYISRPVMNQMSRLGWLDDVVRCPGCGELLSHYDQGYLHMADGDADCAGLLGKGKS